ncbi:hypothetical protein AAFC00_000373 [Neodothiora populina]|uniref:Riboflavin kinase n=1 Tax=Neodothiora populina TaxID=2781224 RepID=A0ABR3PD52_9PEZI
MRPDGVRPTVVGPEHGPEAPFPIRLDGEVVKGFGRGSKDLGIPTANIPLSGLTVGGHNDMESGVYYGWAGLSPSSAIGEMAHTGTTMQKVEHAAGKVLDGIVRAVAGPSGEEEEREGSFTHDRGAVFPMVMSIGWNPFYKNTVRSVEVHILHEFKHDFYGSHMNLVILGFIRPEYDYVSKESLIEDIKTDIEVTGKCLARPAYAKFRHDKSLLDFDGKGKEAQ